MKHSLLILSLLTAISVQASNWPQFRGAMASGLDTNAAAPVTWDVAKGENIRWSSEVPGLGHSSPIIWGDRVYLTTAVAPVKVDLKVGLYGDIMPASDQGPQQWRLLAFDKASGKKLWDKLGLDGIPRTQRHPKGSHCSSTPATDGKFIAAIFGSEGLFCFDMDGKLAWKKDLGPMTAAFFAVPSAEWGFGSSPVFYNGKIVVLCDVLTNSFLAVFDETTGKELWRTARHDVPTWGTPTLASSGAQALILVNGWHHTGGYDFADGKEVWKLDGGGDIPVPTPVVSHSLAYFTSAHGRTRPLRAIRLDAKGDITPAKGGDTNAAIAWVYERRGNYMQTPIVVGDNLYVCFDNGILSCFDAQTGADHYNERLGSGSEGFTASPVSDGKHVYVTSETGRVFVVPATTAFSVLATNRMEEYCMATPALVDGTLFFRTRDRLIAVGK